MVNPLIWPTGPGNNTCTWLRECCTKVEAEVVSNSRNQLHQTTYKYYFQAQYYTLLMLEAADFNQNHMVLNGARVNQKVLY